MPWTDAARPAPRRSAHGRVARGIAAQASGHAAERLVADRYAGRGCEILERCWRSPAGEVDLILRDGAAIVFVEVKKSGTHDIAAQRISRRQMDRICRAALLYSDRLPGGSLTEMRFDAALVDASGRVEIVENAFGLN
ncbi:YraN family protein [Paracoccus sp. MC1862]|nr:YraN family protein [Paracoccus sp. MC1862]MBB1497192.1 YraN family protein [Paracoccus sp. MC1862]QQO46529.1 YraN family protein [Paracoccus sp. MC1862]